MDSCENIRKVNAYHDGELPAAERRELARHIGQCPSCQRELARLRGLSKLLSSVPAAEIPAVAIARPRRSPRARRDRAVLRTAKALTAAAAAVLLVCSVLLWQGGQAGTGPGPSPAEWETAAVAPASAGAEAFEVAVQDDAEVRLVRSIVGSLLPEGGHE